MKPRKPNETDDEYISRLETAYREKAKANERWKRDWKRMMKVLLPAADKAGQIVQYAAEVTGLKDNPEVAATVDGLRSLSSCVWHDDSISIPALPKLPRPEPKKYGGDAEMILLSAIEQVKQTRPPWESWRDVVPELRETDPAHLDWEGIANEVYDALCDLEFSRGLLRLDLRSTMYDYCFNRINRALREAERRSRDERLEDLSAESLPF